MPLLLAGFKVSNVCAGAVGAVGARGSARGGRAPRAVRRQWLAQRNLLRPNEYAGFRENAEDRSVAVERAGCGVP